MSTSLSLLHVSPADRDCPNGVAELLGFDVTGPSLDIDEELTAEFSSHKIPILKPPHIDLEITFRLPTKVAERAADEMPGRNGVHICLPWQNVRNDFPNCEITEAYTMRTAAEMPGFKRLVVKAVARATPCHTLFS